MAFGSRKKEKKTTKPVGGHEVFEKAFAARMGLSPVEYIARKLQTGSELSAIRHLFDIMAAEIATLNHCINPSFDYYYTEALALANAKQSAPQTYRVAPSRNQVIEQLIGKERFLYQYDAQLKALAKNQGFMALWQKLHTQLQGNTTTDIRTKNRIIADYFYNENANRFVEVKAIVDAVTAYGKQASAHISIYYAMYLYAEPNR